MLNAATGVELLLPGDAAGLRRLQERALLQFAGLCERLGVRGSGVDAELRGFDAGFVFAATRDRSLLSTINQRKYSAWAGFEFNGDSLEERAAREWDGLFRHPALGRNRRHNSPYRRPLDLLRERLVPHVALRSVP